jgi:hypothetical protein
MVMIVVPVPIVTTISVVMIMIVIAPLVARFVFLRSDEIYRTIAGVVFPTMLAPILCVPRWYMQIHGWWRGRLRLNDHRLRVHDRRRTCISDSDLTVNARGNLPR